MTTEMIEPMLMTRQQDEINKALKAARGIEDSLTAVVTAWNTLNIGPLTQQELNAIVFLRNAESTVRTRIAGDLPVKIGKLSFDVDQVRKLVSIPDLSALQQAINAANAALNARNPWRWSVDHFDLNGDRASLAPQSEQQLLDAYSLYANTADEQEIYTEILDIKNRLNALIAKYQGLGNVYPVLQRNGTDYFINPHAVQFAALSKVPGKQ